MHYVIAGYLFSFGAPALYGVSLWWRGRRGRG
jgi:hypothetical protein